MSELSRRHSSSLLAMGAVASVFATPSVQYFCAIDEAQFLKESSFDVVAKFVEFVQIVSADAPFLMSDSINSAHFFSLTPCHCACADGGAQQSAVNKNSDVAEIGTRGFMGW